MSKKPAASQLPAELYSSAGTVEESDTAFRNLDKRRTGKERREGVVASAHAYSDMEDLEETSMVVFHGAAHVVTTSVLAGSTLRVEVETEDGKSRWWGDFPAKYVESIALKTGSAKKFPVFVKMLISALARGGSDSVFVDLLTYGDLESLKARRAGSAQQQERAGGTTGVANRSSHGSTTTTTNGSIVNNKRYLILTYASEFDRVHYPLPLAHVDVPNREQLERTIDRLRENLCMRSSEGASSPARRRNIGSEENMGGNTSELVAENAELRRRVEALHARLERAKSLPSSSLVRRSSSSSSSSSGGVSVSSSGHGDGLREAGRGSGSGGAEGGAKLGRLRQAYEELQIQLDDLREAHERLRVDSASEIRKLRKDARDGAKAMELAANAAREAEDQAAAFREELEDSERALQQVREESQREVDKLSQDLARERVNSRAIRAKLRETSSLREIAGPDPRAYGQQRQQPQRGRRRFASPLGAGRSAGRRREGGTAGAGSSAGRSHSAGSNRRSATSPRIVNRRTRSSNLKSYDSSSGLKRRTGRGATPAVSTNTFGNTSIGTGGGGILRGRARRADSPRHGPSSRGSSLASSRGRSRSRSTGSKRGGAPLFDPTAYQRDREARLQRLAKDRKKRERGQIGYSPLRNSGRDSWMGSGTSAAGGAASRGRSTTRESYGSRRSGYTSAGSQGSRGSRASKASSSRSRLSLSGRGSDASSTPRSRLPRRRRQHTSPSATAVTTAAMDAKSKRWSPSRVGPSSSTAATAPAHRLRYSASGKFDAVPSSTSRRTTWVASSRLRNGSGRGGGGGGRGGGAGSAALERRWARSPPMVGGGYGGRVADGDAGRDSPTRRRGGNGGSSGGDGGSVRGGRGFIRLVRDSGTSSASSTFVSGRAGGDRGGEDRGGAPWVGRGWSAAEEVDVNGHGGRDNYDGEDDNNDDRRTDEGGLLYRGRGDWHRRGVSVRVPGATVPADDTATELLEGGSCVGGDASGRGGGGLYGPHHPYQRRGGQQGETGAATAMPAPSRADEDKGTVGVDGGFGGDDFFVPRPAAAAAAVPASRRSSTGGSDRDRDRGGGSEHPTGLASSGGSLGTSSSLRSSGTRRRVEVRTPAEEEEEALRKSQEMRSSLTTLRKKASGGAGGDGGSSMSGGSVLRNGHGFSGQRRRGRAGGMEEEEEEVHSSTVDPSARAGRGGGVDAVDPVTAGEDGSDNVDNDEQEEEGLNDHEPPRTSSYDSSPGGKRRQHHHQPSGRRRGRGDAGSSVGGHDEDKENGTDNGSDRGGLGNDRRLLKKTESREEKSRDADVEEGTEAGREISDIDRRLGQLHDFLRRAKEGGVGVGDLPLPPPPTPLTVPPPSSQPQPQPPEPSSHAREDSN